MSQIPTLSIIVTAYKEEKTIFKTISNLVSTKIADLQNASLAKSIELIVIAPDKPTREVAKHAIETLNANYELPLNFKSQILIDPAKGKLTALNICFEAAKSEWLFLTDGDVWIEPGGFGKLLKSFDEWHQQHQHNSKLTLGGMSMQPVSLDEKTTMLNYWGNLLAAAANHKRKIDLTDNPVGLSTKFLKKRKFFPLSGYGMLIRNIGFKLPEDCLVDDAYISYLLFNKGYTLAYAPEAKVKVKYPQNIKDYFLQKKRSAGGYVQLWKYGIVNEQTKSRSFWRELEYVWFPIKYADSPKELWWSLCLYPARAWLWVKIYWERKIRQKKFEDTWVRIESTK